MMHAIWCMNMFCWIIKCVCVCVLILYVMIRLPPKRARNAVGGAFARVQTTLYVASNSRCAKIVSVLFTKVILLNPEIRPLGIRRHIVPCSGVPRCIAFVPRV